MYVVTGKYELATQNATEALAVAEKINEHIEIAACWRIFAQVEHRKGNADKARDWYKKSLSLFNQLGSRYELAVTRYLASTSGSYDNGEQKALLYLAREYFESEQVRPYLEKIDAPFSSMLPMPSH